MQYVKCRVRRMTVHLLIGLPGLCSLLKVVAASVMLVMAALRSRCGHYIFVLFFSSFFPRLISAVADWMSTILHVVWL